MALKGQNVLITDASAGIGRYIAQRLADESANLILFTFSEFEDSLITFAKHLEEGYPEIRIHTRAFNITDSAEQEIAYSLAHFEFGLVDILVNCANEARGAPKTFIEQTAEDYVPVLSTNVMAFAKSMHKVLAGTNGMRARGKGTILNVINQTSTDTPIIPGEAAFNATMAFQESLTNMVRSELAGTDIKVLALRLGTVASPFLSQRLGNDLINCEAYLNGFEPLFPEDVADTAMYMLLQRDNVSINTMDVAPTAQRSLQAFDRQWDGRNLKN